MGDSYDALPFPRGDTYKQGTNSYTLPALDANFGKSLVGNVYRIRDEYGEGRVKLLRVVQNTSGSTMTLTHKCVAFDTTDYDDFGKHALDAIDAGDVCKPIDDAYSESKTCANYDLFYVVEKGITKVNKPTTGGSGHDPQTALYADTDGKVTETSAGIGYIVGRCAYTAADADTYELVDVAEGLGW